MAASPPASAVPAALDRVSAWQRLLQGLAQEPTVEGQCQVICRELGQSLGFTRAMIATVDEEGRRLITRAAHDPTITAPLYSVLSKLFATPLAPDPDGRYNLSAWCVIKQEQAYIPDVSNYSFRPEATYARSLVVKALGSKEYLLTPLVWRGQSLGLLAVDKKGTGDRITESDRRLVRAVADLTALVLARTPAPSGDEEGPAPPRAEPEPTAASVAPLHEAWQMQSVVDALREGLVVVGPDGTVRYVNRAASRLLHVVAGDAMGRSWEDVVPVVDRSGFRRLLEDGGAPRPSPKKRWKVRLRGDVELDLEIDIVPIPTERMEGARALMLGDASQQVAIERMRDEFTSMLVHDLKAPLQSIVGFAELLRTERLGKLNEDQKRFVSLIETSGTDMMSLAEDILDVAELELGGSLMKKGVVVPNALIDTVLGRLQGKALRAEVELRNEVDADLPALFGDPVRLAETFQNLVDNAIDASPPSSPVRVRAEPITSDGLPYARFDVIDAGPGIEPAAAAHLFDKFWTRQRGEGEGERGKSRGFGLIIAYAIVEAHHGQIGVESQVGRGTTVSVTLPCHREPT